MHTPATTPLRFMTKLHPFTMPSSSQLKISSSNGITPFVSTVPFAVTTPFRTDRPFRDSGQQLAVDRPPLASRLGPLPRPTASNYVTHDASDTEICMYNVWKCTLSDCRYAHLCWTPGCHGSHPGKGCPKCPKLAWLSLNTLTIHSI